jgi:hypothetical protein
MKTHLVVAIDIESGLAHEFAGLRHDQVRAVESSIDSAEGLAHTELMRRVGIWACHEEDVPAVVEVMSRSWVGHEIKIFNLVQIFSRIPGELREKDLTTDGVLPR